MADIRLSSLPAYARIGLPFILLLLVTGSPTLTAQWPPGVDDGIDYGPGDRWTLAPGITYHHVSEVNGWGPGVALTTAYRFSQWGLEFTPTLIFSSNGLHNFSGPAGDLGAMLTVPGWTDAELTLSAGMTGILCSDSDGSLLAKGGPYASVRGHVWLSDWAGLYIRGTGRFFNDGSLGSSGAVGLSVRFGVRRIPYTPPSSLRDST